MAGSGVRPNRVKTTTLGSGHSQFDALQEAKNALILEPETPSIQIADRLAREAPEEAARHALRILLFRLISALRKADVRQKHEQYQLPGMEYLPLIIAGKRDQRTPLLDATYTGVRDWIWRMNATRNDSAKIRSAKRLLKLMRKASKRHPGITVRRAIELYGPIPPLDRKEKREGKR
jgi:hypothetical protein